MLIAVQLPDAASLERTREVTERMNKVFRKFRRTGRSRTGSSSAGSRCWTAPTPRTGRPRSPPGATGRSGRRRNTQQDALVKATADRVRPDAGRVHHRHRAAGRSRGSGSPAGSRCRSRTARASGWTALQERAHGDHGRQAEEAAARFDPTTFTSTFRAGVPQVYLNIDRVKAEQMGVKLDDVFAALQANLGSVYVNDFNKFDRTYQVRVQADARFRGRPEPARPAGGRRTATAARVPLGTLLDPGDADRPAVGHPVQPVPGGGDQRRRPPGRQFRRRPQGDGGRGRRRRCRRRWATMDRRSRSRRSG